MSGVIVKPLSTDLISYSRISTLSSISTISEAQFSTTSTNSATTTTILSDEDTTTSQNVKNIFTSELDSNQIREISSNQDSSTQTLPVLGKNDFFLD